MLGALISQGRTAEIYAWGNHEIVKLYRKGMPAHSINHEYQISTAVERKGLPVPKVIAMVEVEDRQGIIYERVSGKTMMRSLLSHPWAAAKEAHRLAELHYSIHKYDIENIPSYKLKLEHNITYASMLEETLRGEILGYLAKLPEKSSLCHGDFHPDNILIDKDKIIIIDWMTGCSGNPAADVARTSIMLENGMLPPGTPRVIGSAINLVRMNFYKEYIKWYLKISQIDIEEIKAWEVPIAAARLIEWLPMQEKEVLLKIASNI